MDSKPRLKTFLETARNTTEGFFKSFETPEQWTFQVHPTANHALWVAGHLGLTDNFVVTMLSPSEGRENLVFKEKFGMKSQPKSDPAAYPPAAEVLAYLRDRRKAVMGLLDRLSEADLAKPAPPGGPPFIVDQGSCFEMLIWHEGLHAGQAAVARRALGNPPLFG